MFGILLFILSSVITFFAAKRLAYYGDGIASSTGLGRGLVGLILLAAVTSLPEFASSVSASFIGNVDLAFGNVFGSNMTNIFILVILDLFIISRPILSYVAKSNIMTGSIVIFVTTVSVLMMSIGSLSVLDGIDFWYFAPILFLVYIFTMFLLYDYERKELSKKAVLKEVKTMSKGKAIFGFALSSVFVLIAAYMLSYSANLISELEISGKGLGGTFVGTLFMAFATSLPEIVVSISAIRLGSYDMALGNLFGSNLFNLAILSFADISYRVGSFSRGDLSYDDSFGIISPNHIISAMVSILFISIVLLSLMLGRKTKKGILGIDTFTIALFYLLAFLLLFILR